MSDDHYVLEKQYWGDCRNTFYEDQKHYVYAKLMNLNILPPMYHQIDAGGVSVIDIGGGPSSMLLKCVNLKKGLIIDPIEYPEWTRLRYQSVNIDVVYDVGENIKETGWDEAWIYNCLQHTEDPRLIINNAKRAAKKIRIFEWIDIPPHDGHPVELSKDFLDDCLDGKGGTVTLAESGCYGKAYYGVFTY